MEPEGSQPFLQETRSGPYLEPVQLSPLLKYFFNPKIILTSTPGSLKWSLYLYFPIQILYIFFIPQVHTTSHSQFNRSNSISWNVLTMEYLTNSFPIYLLLASLLRSIWDTCITSGDSYYDFQHIPCSCGTKISSVTANVHHQNLHRRTLIHSTLFNSKDNFDSLQSVSFHREFELTPRLNV
jgi:hypothetical protein